MDRQDQQDQQDQQDRREKRALVVALGVGFLIMVLVKLVLELVMMQQPLA